MNTTDYDKQAQDFLDKHGIKFRATLSDSKPAPWTPLTDRLRGNTVPHHYRVTLSKHVSTGSHGPDCFCTNCTRPSRLTFDFWGSIADAEAGRNETKPYDVLACISGDVYTPETFKEFCGEYGYSEDSIQALQTFRRASAFAKRLREFFTAKEIEELSEIQ